MKGGGSGEDSGGVENSGRKDGKGETSVTGVACLDERLNVEDKRGGHSGSEGVQLIDHVLPHRLISVQSDPAENNYAPTPLLRSF